MVLAALVVVACVVLVARERLAACRRLLAAAQLQVAELTDQRERAEIAWRHERMHLLNRIQAPAIAVGEAYAELDEVERTQKKGEPRPTRAKMYRSEHDDGMAEHAEQAVAALEAARRELAARGLDVGEVAEAAAAHRGDHDA